MPLSGLRKGISLKICMLCVCVIINKHSFEPPCVWILLYICMYVYYTCTVMPSSFVVHFLFLSVARSQCSNQIMLPSLTIPDLIVCIFCICEQVLCVYILTAIPPWLSDPCNFITVLLVTWEPEQTTLLFWSVACGVTPHGLHTADRQ